MGTLWLRLSSLILILLFFVKSNAEVVQTGMDFHNIAELDSDYWFVVWLEDNNKVVKHLADKPVVRYSDGSFTLVSEDFTAEFAVNDVRKFTLSDNPDEKDLEGLTETYISNSELLQFSLDSLMITEGTPGNLTLIYGISGNLVGTYVADQFGTTYIPLVSLPTGVLIIKSETTTYKIVKK